MNAAPIRVGKRAKPGPLIAILTKYLGIFGALVLMGALLSIFTNRFMTASNIINVLRQISINAIIAFGMTFVIINGGIDLSVGSVVALVGTVTAGLLMIGWDMYLSIAVGLLLGLLVGLFNGFIIAYTGMPPFVVTLCSMTVCRGSAYLISDGKPVPVNIDQFNFLGNGYLGPIPIPVIFIALTFLICFLLLNRTRFGKYVYALGGNRDAARYSGVNIKSVEIRVYALCGLLSAVSGIILAARMYSGQPTSAAGYELDAIAATVIGGTSMAGGVGAIGGTFLGALIIGVLYNGMNLLKTQFYFQTIAKGIVILLAVYLDMMRHQARGRREMKQQSQA